MRSKRVFLRESLLFFFGTRFGKGGIRTPEPYEG